MAKFRHYGRFDWSALLFVVLVIGVLSMFVLGGIGACQKARYERACLEKGYPAAKVTWAGLGEPFCVKRVDQTDEVIPLESLR